MNIRTRTICLVIVVPAFALSTVPTASAAAPAHERCSELTPDRMPHTADALEAWFRSCDTDRGRQGPSTADGASGWLHR
jgi:hypothetical protein